jgi:two-component system, NarL family, sensor kinase
MTSYLLHPPLLDEMGLQAGLRWYIEGFQERSNIKVSLNLPENLERLPTDRELMIFRVVQECLTNIHRHAESPAAAICCATRAEKLPWRFEIKARGYPPIDSSR